MNEYSDICAAVLEYIKEHNSNIIYEIWFKNMEIISLDDTHATIGVDSPIKQQFMETKYMGILKEAFLSVLGFELNDISISLIKKKISDESFDNDENNIVVEKIDAKSEMETEERRNSFSEKKEELLEKLNRDNVNEDVTEKISEPTIISKYTFDNFVVGESNKFVYSACVAVAKSGSRDYNPLFIWGPSGLGKTHLLCAVTNEIKKNNPSVKIVYKKGDDFTNELIDSIQKKTVSQFREKYRMVDVLLIDDIQFIAGKESTQEEFFNTFTKLYESEKQIILTSDRPPKDIKLLEDRLRTRFEWGLIADIQPPSFELRIAIIKKKAEELSLNISNDIVEYLADKLQNNIRQIEGAIKKIVAVSSLTASPVTMDMCKRCISDFLTGSVPTSVICDRILRYVSEKYSISPDDIKSSKRNGNIANARHLTVYLMRELTSLNLSSIGDILNRDHSTIISSVRKIEKDIKESKSYESEVNELIMKIKG
ncbi:MAG: chromosomal replication initiator protein DnaA [Eubacteriales bacterium]|nr:chromosomal replication initiator protein DnaA [Eubacteriales bacterium]